MLEVALLVALSAARAADLPPGAVLRLGDARWRTGCIGVGGLAISADGKQVATWAKDGTGVATVTVWDVGTGRTVRSSVVNGDLFQGFVWGPGGARAMITRADSGPPGKPARWVPDDFRVWDFTDPKAAPPLLPRRTDPHDRYGLTLLGPKGGPRYTALVPSADGRRVAATRFADDGYAVDVFDLKPADTAAKLARVRSLPLEGKFTWDRRPPPPVLSADGRTLVAFRWNWVEPRGPFGSQAVDARAVDVETGAGGEWFLVGRGVAALTPDGRTLAVSRADEPAGVSLFDARTGKKRVEVADRDGCWALTFAPDGRRLLLVKRSGVVVTDAATGKELGRLGGHAAPVIDAKVSADGRRVATLDLGGLVRVWDADTLRPLTAPAGHTAPVEHAEVSPDGRRVLTWAPDGTTRVWDAVTGRELRVFAGAAMAPDGQYEVRRPAFTPDGLAVVLDTADRPVARDVVTGLEVPLPAGRANPKPVPAPDPRPPGWPAEGPPPAVSPSGREFARVPHFAPPQVRLYEAATGEVRRALPVRPAEVRVLGFSPDGSRLLTAGGDHTVLAWDVRLRAVPLPEAVRRETDAARLWATMCTGPADAAHLAAARLAAEPPAAVRMARLRLRPAVWWDEETAGTRVADARAVELLEALGTPDAREFLKELAGGHPAAWRTREARRALGRAAGSE